MALPIVALNPMRGGAVLIDFSDIFLTDFAQLGLGMVDRSRSSWAKVKGFPNNMELEVEATFSGGGRRYSMSAQTTASPTIAGITLVIHYSLMKTPDLGYHPRMADDRVGHFLSATKDFGVTDADSNFVRLINRWRLEKANPSAKLSPPKKQIVWYVEDTVPIEYRPYVEEGIREWNKAFEKIGFRDAIAVRWAGAGPRRLRPRGHELLHVPLGHQRRRLRHVVPAGQPADRRDDRRRRRLRRQLHPLLEAAVRPADRQHDGRRRRAAGRPRWPSAR